jgi:hypothetical protein
MNKKHVSIATLAALAVMSYSAPSFAQVTGTDRGNIGKCRDVKADSCTEGDTATCTTQQGVDVKLVCKKTKVGGQEVKRWFTAGSGSTRTASGIPAGVPLYTLSPDILGYAEDELDADADTIEGRHSVGKVFSFQK